MNDYMNNTDERITFDNIAIVYNADVKESYDLALKTKKLLCQKSLNSKLIQSDDYDENISFVITIGGDGTILKASRLYSKKNIPIFGINLGRLGFLAQANPDELEYAIDKLIAGEYKIQNRMMLSAMHGDVTALNDIVIKGDTFSRTSRLYLYINDKLLCDYLADGLIISTPTGSTAYTLSAGGPIVSPGLDAVVIVPICPHTLTARPLVIPAEHTIKITSCETCSKLKLSADGQNTIDIASNDYIIINKSKIQAKLVVLERENNGFYSVLQHKLQWGVGPKG